MSNDELRIAVTFPAPSGAQGPVAFGAAVSPEEAHSFKPAPKTRQLALEELEKLGFAVSARGTLSASVRGSRALFERTFGTQLQQITTTTQAGRYSRNDVWFPPQGASFQQPAELSGLIDDAYIQWPHIYMGQRFTGPPDPSPLPPTTVVQHHLRVPHDVSMLLGADQVHRRGVTGRGVVVAMIDSGFAHSHPYFVERGYNVSTILAPGANHRELDGNGHGTGESANLLAMAPDVTFVGVKLDNEDDSNLGASILEGFQEAIRHNPKVISVSLGFDLPGHTTLPNSLRALEAEINAAIASGIVVVFSAGNGHVAFPGMMPDLISAGGTFVEADGRMQASDYASAFKSAIYPGRSVPDFCGLVGMQPHAAYILLPIPSGCALDRDCSADGDNTAPDDGWGVFSGTSAAAPQIAGACALLLEANPGLTPAEVKSILARTCRDVTRGGANPTSSPIPMRAGPGRDDATGFGLIDVNRAVQQA